MGWLTPEDAETAVSALIDKGWLVGNRDELTLLVKLKKKKLRRVGSLARQD